MVKQTKETYIVLWDEGGDDPAEKCIGFKAAEACVRALVKEDGVDPKEIKVFKVLETYKATLDLVKV